MQQHNATDGRKCWRTARERARLRARFLIRERIAMDTTLKDGRTNIIINHDNDVKDDDDDSKLPVEYISRRNETSIALSPLEADSLLKNIVYIQSGDRSKFSLTATSEQYHQLSNPVSTSYLEECLPRSIQLCTAWFGRDYAEFLHDYIQSLSSFTVVEFSTWLGKYSVLGSFLIGGISPCIRGIHKEDMSLSVECMEFWNRRLKSVGAQVMKRFFDRFPLPLSSYIVKRVVDMRLDAHRSYCIENERKIGNYEHSCPKCTQPPYPHMPLSVQLFCSSCGHRFCEPCFWVDLLAQIDKRRGSEEVVLCPICGATGKETMQTTRKKVIASETATEKLRALDIDIPSLTPSQRGQLSRERYLELPINRLALKAKHEKKQKLSELERLACSWDSAVIPSLGSTQEVRRDKFFFNVERNAVHYVRGCLIAGVDVNWRNEYGQTALYIASWKGSLEMVQLLLYYGAMPCLESNGGSTSQSVAEQHGHYGVLRVLAGEHLSDSADQRRKPDDESKQTSLVHAFKDDATWEHKCTPSIFKTVIGLTIKHPGAGSYVIDDAISPQLVQLLLDLWRTLPTDKSNKKKHTSLCAIRSYYCDSEDNVRRLLSRAIEAAGLSSPTEPAIVFPHMRFLNYAEEGIILAPHVDLCRIDPFSGSRSSHTFILYLSNCDCGGETSLLQGLAGDGRSKILAKVSPKRGRLLLFPHACPHEGNRVHDVPKILLRGEVKLYSDPLQEST